MKKDNKHGKTSWLTVTMVAVAAVAILIQCYPDPQLDMENVVLPSAANYMTTSMGVSVSAASKKPLSGLRVAITGATSGIGKGAAKRLCEMGATVIAIGRSKKKLKQLQEDFLEPIETVLIDFSDLNSVAAGAEDILQRFDSLDILVNNAGIHTIENGLFAEQPISKQGYDLPFAVNYLGHFLLTEKLVPLLKNSTHPKVVSVSSRFLFASDGSDLSTVGGTEDPIASLPGGNNQFPVVRTFRQYSASKFAQVVHGRAFNRAFGIPAVAVCPTWVGTQIGYKEGTLLHKMFVASAFDSAGYGLSSLLHAMFDTDYTPDKDLYINTDFEWARVFPSILPYKTLPLLDIYVIASALLVLLPYQKLFPIRKAVMTSDQSYDLSLQDELREWSLKAIGDWL